MTSASLAVAEVGLVVTAGLAVSLEWRAAVALVFAADVLVQPVVVVVVAELAETAGLVRARLLTAEVESEASPRLAHVGRWVEVRLMGEVLVRTGSCKIENC
jgi:hypothetical protein